MENSYNKVWINEEWKALVTRGLEKIGLALDMLEHCVPGCSDRYYAITSIPFRRQAASQAGDKSVSIFQIYRWLVALMRHKGKSPFPTLVPKKTVKEAVSNGKVKHKTGKKPVHLKARKVCDHIPANAKRAEDYVDGVKYRVIVYFGRDVK